MSEAVSTQYTKLFVSSDTGKTWKEVKEPSSIPEMGTVVNSIEVTHLSSEIKEYVPDTPDWSSSNLDFTCNAMPKGSTDSNVDLVQGLDKTTKYTWMVAYTQLGAAITFTGRCRHRYGAAAPGSKQDLILTVIPCGDLDEIDYDATSTVTLATS